MDWLHLHTHTTAQIGLRPSRVVDQLSARVDALTLSYRIKILSLLVFGQSGLLVHAHRVEPLSCQVEPLGLERHQNKAQWPEE